MSEVWEYPQWTKAGKVHDWRNYVSEDIRAHWPMIEPCLQRMIYEQAEEIASAEEWE